MKQKRMFKRHKERHPVKWTAVTVGLLTLTCVSFGAGVQFATVTLESPSTQFADTEQTPGDPARLATPLRVAHQPGQDT